MNNDFEEFKPKRKRSQNKQNRCKDDLPSMFSDLFNAINYKIAILLFILGVIIFSDVFIELFLVPISGAVYGDVPTNKGTMIQLLALTFGYIIIDLLSTGEII